MEERDYRPTKGIIRRFFGFFEDVYFRFTHFDSLSKDHKREFERANKFYFENEGLRTEVLESRERSLGLKNALSRLESEKANLSCKIVDIEKESRAYKIQLESDKDLYGKQIGKQREEYETRINEDRTKIENSKDKIDELGRLVGHLKKDKKEIRRFADYVVREKSTEPLIEFLKNSKIPYVLVNPRNKRILDYNSSFATELGINGSMELRDQSYLAILDGKENKDSLQAGLKRFLDTEEKKEFDVNYDKGGKKVLLHITKQKPLSISIDLRLLGKKDKEARVVTCIPLVVEKASTWQKYHPQSLEKVMAQTQEEEKLNEEAKREMPGITSKLVRYNWMASEKIQTSDKIIEIMDKMGDTKSYLYFKKIVSELDLAANKKAQEEETARKVKRKKEARIRLKRLNSNPRRINNIITRLVKRDIEEEKIKEILCDSNLTYIGFRERCAELLKEYRKSLEEMRGE
jgi:hypothetical protein